jgi:DNA helicase-4
VAKVDYLVRHKLARADQILVLAFARQAKAELEQRIGGLEHGSRVKTSTFHSLGHQILSSVEGRMPTLTDLSANTNRLYRFVSDNLNQMRRNTTQARLIEEMSIRYYDRKDLLNPARSSRSSSGSPYSDFVKLVAQFIPLFKGQSRGMLALLRAAPTHRDRLFLNIFESVLERYTAELEASGTIDFNDMISRSRQYLRDGRWKSPYTRIIVDEFQDIAPNPFGLLQDLRAQVAYARLYVVGDDWHSIYRFSGSDVSIMTNLPEHAGAVARVNLDVAFRYPQELLNVTSQFVMQNPEQLRKHLVSHQGASMVNPVCVIFDEKKPNPDWGQIVLDQIPQVPPGDSLSVFLIGRYGFSKPANWGSLCKRFAAHGLNLEYLTAHAAKGREADFVILVNMEAGEYGFPSNIADDPVLHMVQSREETYPLAEERRLFYVAMTRARRRVFLIAPADNASPFVSDDLLSKSIRPFVTVIGEPIERPMCPDCGQKTIAQRPGSNGPFWACTRFPTCKGTLDHCPECANGGLYQPSAKGKFHCTDCDFTAPVCAECKRGAEILRDGQYGQFLTCTRWKYHRNAKSGSKR